MLNYETLLSSYDDKLTLMQWLRKVEKALAGASASSFEVIKTGNATIRFRINFEDGTYLESGDIVLQQGESVASGEIRNGHLYLTLTNGQELDCGELFNGEVPSLEVRSLEVTGGLLVGDDANAAVGGDLVVHGLTEVQNLLAYGQVETETLKINTGVEVKGIDGTSEYAGNIRVSSLFTISASYCKAVVNFRELQFIFNARITNNDTEAHNISDDTTICDFGVLPNEILTKIYGHNGNACTPYSSVGSIAYAPLFISATTGTPISASMPRYVNLFQNSGIMLMYIEGGSVSIPANTSYDFEVRISLAL